MSILVNQNQSDSMRSGQLRGIYGITDDQLLPAPKLLSAVESALKGGICLLQYRSKQTSGAEKNTVANELLSLCKTYSTPLIINDDAALCKAVGADGVHLGRDDGSVENTRELLGPRAIIGVTCHNDIARAERAQSASADYVAFGRFFPSQTKPSASAADIDVLIQAKLKLQLPIVAIGGINAQNGGQLIEAGANMLAVVNSLFGNDDIEKNTQRLTALFN